MMEISASTPTLKARRKSIVINPKIGRVITRPYLPSGEERIRKVIKRVLSLDENEACTILETVLREFSHRHRYFRETLQHNFERVADYMPSTNSLSEERRLLIGTYFTAEYSVEAAALFNPSLIPVPNQEADPEGSCRFVMSFRATGEGHISSIEFRSGIIDKNNDIYFDPLSDYVRTPRIHTDASYDLHLFRLKLQEMGASNAVTHQLLNKLPDNFTFNDLQGMIAKFQNNGQLPPQEKTDAINMALWLAESNYEILFRPDHQISERVIFPVSESESKGIEDARFVRFVDDDGSVIYYATYTAYNGERILPQLIETCDFLSFKISTLNGKQAQGKGMALFPRRIKGRYVMLARLDGVSHYVLFSDSINVWSTDAKKILGPEHPWEFLQVGNCGSPLETDEGWLVVTHGVGPVRRYCLGAMLLDTHDPTKIIARLEDPLMIPNEEEREGYVPNVVYSCGAMIHDENLYIPYAMSDLATSIACVPLDKLLAQLNGK